jgi:molybdopterin converting factor small subunit
MTIQLNYRGQLAIAANSPSEEINPRPGTSVADVVRAAAARHGEAFAKLILATDGTFRSTLLIALDGDQIQDPEATRLSESCKDITLLPPIAGG